MMMYCPPALLCCHRGELYPVETEVRLCDVLKTGGASFYLEPTRQKVSVHSHVCCSFTALLDIFIQPRL
jgi:hypothetical protein